jgi:cobaltochelatase CobS
MDRWSIVTTLNYLPHDVEEAEIVLAKAPTTTPPRASDIVARWSASPT